jgi:cytochrome c peroxidase
LLLDSLRYKNAAGETLSITRLSYLLSGFALERADGVWVELPGQYAWMDAAQRRAFIRFDGAPAGSYRSVRFHVGPEAAANAADPAKFASDHPLNPNLNGLHWSWQGGYIFLAVEGRYRRAGEELKGFAHHLARDPNRTRITVAAQLDLNHDARVELDFDVATLLNAPRPLSFEKDGSSTHSRANDPIAAALVANLPGAFRVRQIESAAPELATRNSPPTIRNSELETRNSPRDLPEKFTPYRFKLSGTFALPELPRDNPLIEERVALGEKLFYEPALSRDGTLSCASCHEFSSAFADPRRYSVGVRGQIGTRNAMPLFNLAWKTSYFWDGRAPSLRAQALMPIQDHTEMDENLTNVVSKLEPDYRHLFARAFRSPAITPEKIGLALEQFLLTLTSYDSKFDRSLRGDGSFSAEEQRGFELFMTEYEPRTGQYGADCFHCHGGALFSDHQFHNNGLSLAEMDVGRRKVTQFDGDRGKFSTPSLRNVELTAPYMHDGRFATLEEVVAHYSTGVKSSSTLDPNLAKHPASGLQLGEADRKALVAFLKTLTDEKYRVGTNVNVLAGGR